MVVIVTAVLALLVSSSSAAITDYANATPVELFQEYLQINTTTNNDLGDAVRFWTYLAEAEHVPINVYEFVDGYPVIILKWAGNDSSLGSIMLNSHMDVVPADEDDGWTYPPFSGYIDENGDIYGRGTQDMKSVSIQYYEALRRIKAKNITLLRDVYMTLMPDEEVGAESGMIPFLKSAAFEAMNVGLELDEGTSFPLPVIGVFYQDKSVWQIQVDCYGTAAHGSTFPETNNTATGKCRNVMDRLLAFRDEQYEISNTAFFTDSGVYTSINLNKMNGGTANNVIPSHVSLVFDIRLSTTLNEEEFNISLSKMVYGDDENITITFISKDEQTPATIANSTNPYWTALSNSANSLGITILPVVPPGSTDARHVRSAGVPAFGFSPMPNTTLLLHSVDERLNVATFRQGIDIYENLITELANVSGNLTNADPSVYMYKTTA